MSMLSVMQNPRCLSLGSPINPSPIKASRKKCPPLTIKLNLTKSSLSNPEVQMLHSKNSSIDKSIKLIENAFPAIKISKGTMVNYFKHLSPVSGFHFKNLKPLLRDNKIIGKSLESNFSVFDKEVEDICCEKTYRIYVTTKKRTSKVKSDGV